MIADPDEAAIRTDSGQVGAVDGDAASYLDELVVASDGLPATLEAAGSLLLVELVGPHLRLSGSVPLGRFRRLTDVLNHTEGFLRLHEATVLRRNGTPTRVRTPAIWVSPAEVTIVGQREEPQHQDAEAAPEFRVQKEVRGLVVVTPGHVLMGNVYVPVGGELSAFIESPDPDFIPMVEVRTRSLADRRVITRYAFALLNRRHIVAATETHDGMSSHSWSV